MVSKAPDATWISNQPLTLKLLLPFSLVLLLFVGASLVNLWVSAEESDARRATTRTYDVLIELQDAQRSLRVQQAGLRGFLVSGFASELLEFEASSAEFDAHLEEAAHLTRDSARHQVNLQRVREISTRWREDVALPAIEQVQQALAQPGVGVETEMFAVAAENVRRGSVLVGEAQNLFFGIERDQRLQLLERTDQLSRTVRLSFWLTTGLLLLALVTGAVLIALTRIHVTRPIREMTGLMTRLADNDHDIHIRQRGRGDEIGSMARALEVFRQTARNNFRQQWVKGAVGEIAGNLQGTRTLTEFGDCLCAGLAEHLGASGAALHLLEEEGRTLLRSGAFAAPVGSQSRHALGEGLVGGCAATQRPLLVDALPRGYMTLRSGLGEAAPACLLLKPLLASSRLCGVIEVALLDAPGERELQLIEELLPVAALSLENLQRAMRTDALLVQTREQAHELQASEESLRLQQEELRATNEALQRSSAELRDNTGRLEASEEELRVQAEELQASNAELRASGTLLQQQKSALEALQRETEEKADELSRASQYKSDFLANMSHELRTPLNSLLILSRGLAENRGGRLDADEVESAEVMFDAGSSLLRLINDILDLSKVEAGKMELAPEELPVAELVTLLKRRFGHVAADKGLNFEVDLQADAPELIVTDPSRLDQILNNLLSNAIKFTGSGAVTVRIAGTDASVDPGAGLSIAVIDSGIGIAQDKFERVFEAFEQVDAGTSRRYGGTGLGLAISRRIARLLGGDIALSSEPGQGSEFTLWLPLVAPASAGSKIETAAKAAPPDVLHSTAPPEDDRSAPPCVLIIEAEADFRRMLAETARARGWRVTEAGNGAAGLAAARNDRPDAVLLDLGISDMDGWDLLQVLRDDPTLSEVPVHVISASDDLARNEAIDAANFLSKPVNPDSLIAAVGRLRAPGAPQRILVVDDDTSSRVAIRRVLSGKHMTCDEAADGASALARLDDQRYDCIVLDLGLPDISGFEVLKRAAAIGELPPVVVYSARELSREESATLRQYTDSIVIKGEHSPGRLLEEVGLFLRSLGPGAAARPAPESSAASSNDAALAGRCVLVVDDDMRNIFALSKALRARGLNVVMASDGEKALRALEENREIELVLMDVMMPGMDGLEATRRIRAHPQIAKMPVIALTAKAMAGDRAECLAAGANDYLTKPVDLDRLFSLLHVWLHAA